jgi:hypothetical protein
MRARPHCHGRTEKHEPHEAGSRHLIVPDKSAAQYIAGEHTKKEIDCDYSEEEDTNPLQARIEHLFE